VEKKVKLDVEVMMDHNLELKVKPMECV